MRCITITGERGLLHEASQPDYIVRGVDMNFEGRLVRSRRGDYFVCTDALWWLFKADDSKPIPERIELRLYDMDPKDPEAIEFGFFWDGTVREVGTIQKMQTYMFLEEALRVLLKLDDYEGRDQRFWAMLCYWEEGE